MDLPEPISSGVTPNDREPAVRPHGRERRLPVEATLEVGDFDRHGTARAPLNGRQVETPHAIPGETISAQVYGKRRRWARITEVLNPSPDRVDAPCAHFHVGCGGCQWQMLSYRRQVEDKVGRTQAELNAAGLDIEIRQTYRPADPWRYRRTAGLSLGRSIGFRRHGTQSIVAVEDCPISHPLIGRVSARLNHALREGRIPNFGGQLSLELRVCESEASMEGEDPVGARAEREHGGASAEGLHACIVPSPGSAHASVDAVMPLARLLVSLDWVWGVMYRHRQQPARVLYGEPFGWTSVLGRPFALSAATFFQTNRPLLASLCQALRRAQADAPPGISGGSEEVVDVYGGVGVFGLLLADQAERVVEIEIDPVAAEAARLSAARQGLTNVDVLVGTAESILARIERADTVVVDPPRAGLSPGVISAIGRLKPARIMYVSCLAQSLARDVVAFTEHGYVAEGVELFDFYPQTYHVELFAVLRRRGW